MTTDRIQRRVEQLLDQADEAVTKLDWAVVRDRAQAVITIDPENADAKSYMEIAERGLGAAGSHPDVKRADSPSEVALSQPPTSHPTSFANGRYQVKKFLGEGMGLRPQHAGFDVLRRLLPLTKVGSASL